MFEGARAFSGDVSTWDVSSVTDMSAMFEGALVSFNSDLSAWDMSRVTDM
jgi:surface protein